MNTRILIRVLKIDRLNFFAQKYKKMLFFLFFFACLQNYIYFRG